MKDYSYFPSVIDQAMSVCALRFAGYEFENRVLRAIPGETGGSLYRTMKPLVRSLRFYKDEPRNFAVFFCLQRGLHKWGGEYLTKYSQDHLAYDLLFLHLYHRDVPLEFRNEEYCVKWTRQYAPDAERTAAFVRKTLRRKGQGKAIAL
ncbi:MAG: hypothetical protein HS115_00675 [Spirochaetales bacterium]|nr:hypothetical protein [Spirochaetales bacterium]